MFSEPLVSFKHCKNLRDILVRAKLHSGGEGNCNKGDVLRVVSLDVRFVPLCVIVRLLEPTALIRTTVLIRATEPIRTLLLRRLRNRMFSLVFLCEYSFLVPLPYTLLYSQLFWLSWFMLILSLRHCASV